MQSCQHLVALAVIGVTAVAVPAVVAQPSEPPGATPPSSRSQQEAVPKSDEHRVVGEVLQIDREQGLVRLATDEGVFVAQAAPAVLQAIKVGDIISVPRSGAKSPTTLPRQ
jgi:hypothetical protein